MTRIHSFAAVAALALLLPAASFAQQPPTPGQPPAGQPPVRPGGPPGAPANKPQPYDQVITKEAKSSKGLVTAHTVGDKYYFEIPTALLGKDLLWVTSLERSQSFYGFGMTEVSDRVIRFERRGDKILLRSVSFRMRADEKSGDVSRALGKGNIEPILASYDVKAYGANESSVVLDAGAILYGELSGLRFDQSRSFIESMKAFPQNLLVKITGTQVANPAAAIPGLPIPRRGGGASGPDTVVVNHNLLLLPEKPMKPRIADSRVGWFSTGFQELGGPENRVKDVVYIDRWRLEKKDPTAALSEPIKPIVYYLGEEIPAKWKPFVKKGVEAWNAAFEKAGFKNAVICRDIPSKEEDPEFDPEDIRYTVIHWLPSGVENAYGPHISDPRTGEILNGSPKIFHNVLKLAADWYFAQASPNDKRAQKLPLPDDLTGDLLAYIVTHEVGHTLGFPHNFRGSSTYSIKQLRDPAWTRQWGVESSVMDYGRFNYVAQPGDGATLIPKLGPYDLFAVEWGYSPIPGAATPDDEKPALNAIAGRQVANRQLRFGNPSGEDPTRQSEDLGDDTVEATRLGMLNIDRVLGYLVAATTKPGDDYSLLRETYATVLGQRNMELRHCLAVVGGVIETEFHAGQGAVNYVPVPAAKQKAAVQLFVDQLFKTPKSLIRPDIVYKLQSSGIPSQILGSQQMILGGLLSETRMQRLIEQSAMLGASAYAPTQLLDDLKAGIWTELGQPRVAVDLYRRNLQRAYVSLLAGKLTGSGEVPALVRGALEELRDSVKAAQPRAADKLTRLHLADSLRAINNALDPKVIVQPAAPAPTGPIFF